MTHKHIDTLQPIFIVFLTYFFLASVFTVGKLTLQYTSPYFLTGTRFLLAGGVLLFLQVLLGRSLYIPRKLWKSLFVVAFFGVFLTNALEFWGLQYLPAAKTSLIYCLSPFASIILSFFILQEKLTFRKLIGLCIGMLGYIIIITPNTTSEDYLISYELISMAELAVTCAAVSCILGWVYMKKIVVKEKFSIILSNAATFILAGSLSLALSYFVEDWDPIPVWDLSVFLAGMAYIAFIHNILGFNLYAYCLKKLSVTFMSFAGVVNPLLTALIGWIVLGEGVGAYFFLSIGLILCGLFLFYREEISLPFVENPELEIDE
ncbi:MAG: DMT family transporter [Chlamydiales bacterium]